MDTHGRWSMSLLESDTLCHGGKGSSLSAHDSAAPNSPLSGLSNHLMCFVLNLYVGHTLVGPCHESTLNFDTRPGNEAKPHPALHLFTIQ